MQFINYGRGTVQVYHTLKSKQGTDGFECGGIVNLTLVELSPDKKALSVECPGGCGSVSYVPLAGDADAQRLHAHKRVVDQKGLTLPAAIESVLRDNVASGYEPNVGLALEAITLLKEDGVPSEKISEEVYPQLKELADSLLQAVPLS